MKNILIVDDTPTNLRILQILLSKSGCNVIAFETPENCLAWASENLSSIDLAIIDYQMPNIQGDELCEKLRLLGYKNNIIILTAFNGLSLSMLKPEAEITTVINKPISYADVQYMLKRWSEADNDARREPRKPLATETNEEVFLYKDGGYITFNASRINESDHGIAFKLQAHDFGLISSGHEIVLENGINYSVRWVSTELKRQVFGACRIL